MNEGGQNLDELLKKHKISQRTYDRVTVAKEYIEQKYNLKSIINTKWNEVLQKINNLNINGEDKNRIINEINSQVCQKFRKNREKQSIHEYESISIIGRGAFGEVHVCREIKTGNIYAIKKMKKDILTQKNQVIHIRSEKLIMAKVKSPWIVDLKASFQEDDYLYLVMEFLQGGDFMSLLIKKDILTEEEARFYTAELILAVDSIHKLGCIHRDIKPDNILIDRNGHIKLSDFGLAKISDKIYNNNKDENFDKNKLTHQKNYSCVGTAYYVAPEVLKKSGYGKDIDWWSVGVIFYEMLVGYAPFCSEETKEVCYKVINWEKYLKIPDDVQISREAEDLINKMINNPDERLGKNGIEEIKSHPFFKGVDWDNIRNTKAPFIPDIKNDYDTKYFEHFEIEEPFYPPPKRFKKRKDIEFLGYTYKDENDPNELINDENDINEGFKEIMKKMNIKEKDGSKLSNLRGKKPNNNIKRINTNKNNNIVNMMKKQEGGVNKSFDNKIKGKSPPLFSKMNKNNISNIQPQKPLKKIKIADKGNQYEAILNKSSISSNKYQKLKLNNKIGILPAMSERKNDIKTSNSQKGILRKKNNGMNENKIIKIYNNNTKKATSLKNVKKIGILTNNKNEDNKK